MSKVSLHGTIFNTSGNMPAVGSQAPAFKLVNTELKEISLADFSGRKVVLNIFPSVDTPVCATSIRTFNEALAKHDDTVVLCVSADLPFAQQRFCGTEGLERVMSASTFRNTEFGTNYGVAMVDGPLCGLMSRAVVVIDENGKVVHCEQVSEISEEPNYGAALEKL